MDTDRTEEIRMLVDASRIATTPDSSGLATHASGTTPAIVFDGAVKRFGDVRALDGIGLSIAAGSTVALLGPNGAGKTTAISLTLGLLQPDGGTVRTLGLAPRTAVESGRVGAMLQSSGLPAGARVGELVEFARTIHPHPLGRHELLERSGLTGLAGRPVTTLSGGESQRLRFAVAIAGDPDLVFLDEPTVAMDVETRRSFWASMRRFTAEGRTVLFATHYLEEADQVADRIVVLDHGRVVADGTPASIKAGARGRTVRFTLADPDREHLSLLPGVIAEELHGSDVTLRTEDADATVAALYAAGLAIRDLEVTGADLESAFVALTSERAA
jgi:ABC-2 type transport system ATP-binding protein